MNRPMRVFSSGSVGGRSRPQTDAPLMRLTDIGVTVQGRAILRGVTLTIRRGQLITVVGPNGGGKSTLAKVVTGLRRPTEGQLDRPRDLRVGYVPQSLTLDPTLPLTVRRLLTLTRRHDRAAVLAALARTGVAHLIDQSVHVLSGGERQRVLLARALLGRPDLLVLDEPVQGVDYAGEAALYDLIGALKSELGCAILMISHDLHLVMAATDEVLCLNGHVCCSGSPAQVTDHTEFRRLFGPRAADSYGIYRHHHDHEHDCSGEVVEATDAA